MIRASVPVRLGGRRSTVIAVALLLAACQPGSSAPTSTQGPGSSGSGGATPTIQPPTSFGPPPSPTAPDDTSPVVLDGSLLAILPESIDGFAITEAVDEAALALTDPGLPRIATALDAGVAVDTGGGNLVYALVVRLRPDTLTEDEHRQWRDSFDEGACAAAGGVAGNATATIAGGQVFITSCVQGLRTYHVWLQGPDILISASSIGAGRFGEKLMASLRVPA